MGMALLLGLLIFMACFHSEMLSEGASVLTTGYMPIYGWASVVGVLLQLIGHETGTWVVAWWLKIPLRFRPFAFGANASAILENLPRQTWRDAVVGFAGPVTGTGLSVLSAGIYAVTKFQDSSMHVGEPFFLGIACFGFFYNLLTLVPILNFEGGWIAPAILPQAWLAGLVVSVLELTNEFNLVLLGVVSFAVPRLILLIRARAPRTDLNCTARQRLIVSIGYFVLVIVLAWLASHTFVKLGRLVPAAMGD